MPEGEKGGSITGWTRSVCIGSSHKKNAQQQVYTMTFPEVKEETNVTKRIGSNQVGAENTETTGHLVFIYGYGTDRNYTTIDDHTIS